MPALASQEETDPEDEVPKNKVLVRSNQIYHFQEIASLAANPSSNAQFHTNNNQSFVDGIREGTLRTWYAYGWGTATDNLAAGIEAVQQTAGQLTTSPIVGTIDTVFGQPVSGEDPGPPQVAGLGNGASPSAQTPMFGYFPFVKNNVNDIEADRLAWLGRFHIDAAMNSVDPNIQAGSTDFYFDMMADEPKPSFYISDFKIEEPISEVYERVTTSAAAAGAATQADTLAYLDNDMVGDWDAKAIIHAYHWLTEPGLLTDDGEPMGPDLEFVIEACGGNVQTIIDEYTTQGWAVPAELYGRYNAYLEVEEEIAEFMSSGWTREFVRYAYDLGEITALQVKQIYEEQNWRSPGIPADIQEVIDNAPPPLSLQKMRWLSAWMLYDRCDGILNMPLWVNNYQENPYISNRSRRAIESRIGGLLGAQSLPRFGADDRGPRFPEGMEPDSPFANSARSPWLDKPRTGVLGIGRGGETNWLELKVSTGELTAEDFDLWFGSGWGEGWRFYWNADNRCIRRQGGPPMVPGGYSMQPGWAGSSESGRANLGPEWRTQNMQGNPRGRQWMNVISEELYAIYDKAKELDAERGAYIDPFAGAPSRDLGSSLAGRVIMEQTIGTLGPIPAFTMTLESFRDQMSTDADVNRSRHACVIDALTSKDIKLSGWRRSLVTVKPYPGTNFEEVVNSKIKPSLNKDEIFVPGIIDVRPEVSGPKRYYDYAFQLPTVDKQTEVRSVYNGYFAADFENQIARMPLILEPVIPNLYIVDFANTSISEYYELLSLNAGVASYPNGYISEFNASYPLGTPAYQSLFEPFGYTSEYRYTNLWIGGVQKGMSDIGPDYEMGRIKKLSDKYKNLIFSETYRQNYLNTTNEARSNSGYVPMYNQIDFSLKIRAPQGGFTDQPGLIFHAGVFGNPSSKMAQPPYDPMTHLISDVGMSVHHNRLFAESHTAQSLPAEKTRTGNGREDSRANANVISENLEISEDFKYQNNKVWDIHEWFELYNIPDRADISSFCLDQNFYDQRAFAEQFLMLTGPAPGKSAPPSFVASASRVKPVPVGGKPQTVDLNQYLPSCPTGAEEFSGAAFVEEGGEVEVGVPLPDYTNPASILLTPDRTEWRDNSDEMPTVPVIRKALEDLYDNLTTSVQENFRTYRQVVDGQLAYSEPLFYRLNKIDPTTGNTIQSFFFPAGLLRNGFTYIDAQVHYGAQYDYLLLGYYFVVGNEYWYEDLSSGFALEHRTKKFVSGNEIVAQKAYNQGVSEDEYLINAYNNSTAPYISDPERALGQIALLHGITLPDGTGDVAAFEAVVAQARLHVGPNFENMRDTFGDLYYQRPIVDDHHVQFAVNNRPHMVLVETTVFSPSATRLTTKMVDSPPLPPDVDIVPYRSVNNRVLLMLNGSVGSYIDKPIIIDQQDVINYRNQISNQNPSISPDTIAAANIEKDFEISFSTDDFPEFFEIYRLDTPPMSYRDFANGTRRRLNNAERGRVVQTANSFIDRVEPNKKYWYTFRTVDVHGNMSNPSEILQFEMIDTGNSIYPDIEGYSFPKQEIVYAKPMRKYLRISPSTIQETKHTKATNAQKFVDFPTLGSDAEKSVWGDKYKLRITSKLTGKKIDINFIFKQGGIENKL